MFVAESHETPDAKALEPGRLGRSYGRALTHRSSIGHALLGALSFGCLFSFVSASPFVFVGALGLTTGWFAALFAVCSLGITAGSLLCGLLTKRGVDPRRLLAAGVLAQAFCSVILLALALLGAFHVADAVLLIVLSNAAMGLVGPLAAGVASAVRGCLQMLGGAAASALVSFLFSGTPTALPLSMSVFALASCLVWALMLQGQARHAARAVNA